MLAWRNVTGVGGLIWAIFSHLKVNHLSSPHSQWKVAGTSKGWSWSILSTTAATGWITLRRCLSFSTHSRRHLSPTEPQNVAGGDLWRSSARSRTIPSWSPTSAWCSCCSNTSSSSCRALTDTPHPFCCHQPPTGHGAFITTLRAWCSSNIQPRQQSVCLAHIASASKWELVPKCSLRQVYPPTHGPPRLHSQAIPLALAEGGRGFQTQFALGKSVPTVPDLLSCPSCVWKQAPVDSLSDPSSDQGRSD